MSSSSDRTNNHISPNLAFPTHHHKDHVKYVEPPKKDTQDARGSSRAGSGTRGGHHENTGSTSSQGGRSSGGGSAHHENSALEGKKKAWHRYF
ncbi:hypothetical protein MGN70_000049 [Eutypa lata]|nr:hypothetical protein MGN70_000049 [Eutypa lata]